MTRYLIPHRPPRPDHLENQRIHWWTRFWVGAATAASVTAAMAIITADLRAQISQSGESPTPPPSKISEKPDVTGSPTLQVTSPQKPLSGGTDTPDLSTTSQTTTSQREPIMESGEEIIIRSQREPTEVISPRPWYRLPEPVDYMRLDPFLGVRLSYVELRTGLLKTLHLKNRRITTIAGPGIGGAYTWARDGIRLIYRSQVRKPSGKIHAQLGAYDHKIHRTITLDSWAIISGYPTLDPRDNFISMMVGSQIIQKKMKLPSSRLARWHMRRAQRSGRFIAAPKGMVFVASSERGLRTLKDDGTGLQSYDISPRGGKVVWATKGGGIYWAEDLPHRADPTTRLIAYGRDPVWSVQEDQVLFSGARVVGDRVAGYDIRLLGLDGQGRWLTQTFSSQERWPVFLAGGHILYTIEQTTDLFGIRLPQRPRNTAPKTSPEDQENPEISKGLVYAAPPKAAQKTVSEDAQPTEHP